jgi:hypothetical protein
VCRGMPPMWWPRLSSSSALIPSQIGTGHCRRTTRGFDLAANALARYASSVLVVPAALLDGPHASDCYHRLAFLHASLEAPVDYDVPPPPPEERIYIQHRVIFFGDPAYDLPPPRLHSVALG